MMPSVWWVLSAIVVLLGSLALSLATGGTAWFLFGYPVAMLLAGIGDPDRKRGRVAILIGIAALGAVVVAFFRIR